MFVVCLHNFLTGEPIDKSWVENKNKEDDVLPSDRKFWDDDDPNRHAADDTRRKELFYYLSELEETAIN